eukprot:CAMPEP_0197440054 /NCGR_PEP_ID=MMETSP1175-20131217/6648_1 /TAXON_ID=1003142 /ORGANISM="Triceratium dubium, Strain CCMP147" /LENGTH=967 /DNA_ID=CAMNT_0042970085 /DNA_START=202 /DNA_END=3102 /DNA_ORIENTATION=-
MAWLTTQDRHASRHEVFRKFATRRRNEKRNVLKGQETRQTIPRETTSETHRMVDTRVIRDTSAASPTPKHDAARNRSDRGVRLDIPYDSPRGLAEVHHHHDCGRSTPFDSKFSKIRPFVPSLGGKIPDSEWNGGGGTDGVYHRHHRHLDEKPLIATSNTILPSTPNSCSISTSQSIDARGRLAAVSSLTPNTSGAQNALKRTAGTEVEEKSPPVLIAETTSSSSLGGTDKDNSCRMNGAKTGDGTVDDEGRPGEPPSRMCGPVTRVARTPSGVRLGLKTEQVMEEGERQPSRAHRGEDGDYASRKASNGKKERDAAETLSFSAASPLFCPEGDRTRFSQMGLEPSGATTGEQGGNTSHIPDRTHNQNAIHNQNTTGSEPPDTKAKSSGEDEMGNLKHAPSLLEPSSSSSAPDPQSSASLTAAAATATMPSPALSYASSKTSATAASDGTADSTQPPPSPLPISLPMLDYASAAAVAPSIPEEVGGGGDGKPTTTGSSSGVASGVDGTTWLPPGAASVGRPPPSDIWGNENATAPKADGGWGTNAWTAAQTRNEQQQLQGQQQQPQQGPQGRPPSSAAAEYRRALSWDEDVAAVATAMAAVDGSNATSSAGTMTPPRRPVAASAASGAGAAPSTGGKELSANASPYSFNRSNSTGTPLPRSVPTSSAPSTPGWYRISGGEAQTPPFSARPFPQSRDVGQPGSGGSIESASPLSLSPEASPVPPYPLVPAGQLGGQLGRQLGAMQPHQQQQQQQQAQQQQQQQQHGFLPFSQQGQPGQQQQLLPPPQSPYMQRQFAPQQQQQQPQQPQHFRIPPHQGQHMGLQPPAPGPAPPQSRLYSPQGPQPLSQPTHAHPQKGPAPYPLHHMPQQHLMSAQQQHISAQHQPPQPPHHTNINTNITRRHGRATGGSTSNRPLLSTAAAAAAAVRSGTATIAAGPRPPAPRSGRGDRRPRRRFRCWKGGAAAAAAAAA